ncbi:trypco2 family protein [Nocardia bovistercoris]|uniref:Trypsin-co-occurring domain-containing protein n=1 Tax=Nocardia bovistercoris TaxID=2785916 RepID=A0A931IKU9_9NOCA|nr:trypco2 family protein [Nocardia bovistercoris]MBH0781480.1 hypothetical protein [Nocardia bovistercoris]
MSEAARTDPLLPSLREPEKFELTDVIAAVRAQLSRAVAASAESDIRLQLGDIELEFTVALTSDAKASAGIKLWVLNAGASVASATTTTQRLKIALKPVTSDGTSVNVSDEVTGIPSR